MRAREKCWQIFRPIIQRIFEIRPTSTGELSLEFGLY